MNDDLELARAAELVPDWSDKLDQIEAAMVAGGGEYRSLGGTVALATVTHHFTPGLYARRMERPAGSLVSTVIHATTHQWVLSHGTMTIWSAETGPVTHSAPAMGTTTPGTRRLSFAHTDIVFTTFHATDLTDIDEIERWITQPHVNKYLQPLLKDTQ